MNIKSLITISVIALVSASAVQAADVVIPYQETASEVIIAPAFSWAGFYLGAPIGGSLGKFGFKDKDQDALVFKGSKPKLSGFIGGIYAGSNFYIGNDLVFGVETDMIWSGKKV